MILTVTFNPALDISGTVDQLIPDEKSYVYDEVHTPGGNGINAAVVAHSLQAPVMATGFLGGSTGEEIADLLHERNLPHSFVPIQGQTRINLTVSNRENHRQTRLSFPGPRIRPKEREALQKLLLRKYPRKMVVLGGSLPPGLPPAYVKNLVRQLRWENTPCFVDMPGPLLKEVLPARPFFIKPNLTEFQDLVGKKVQSRSSVLASAREVLAWVPLICVSSVEGGAILLREGEACFGKIPPVQVRSTVGAGDSMVGAIVAKYSQDPRRPLEELLRWGLAAACATLTEKGMKLGSRRAILKYYPQVKTHKLA